MCHCACVGGFGGQRLASAPGLYAACAALSAACAATRKGLVSTVRACVKNPEECLGFGFFSNLSVSRRCLRWKWQVVLILLLVTAWTNLAVRI